MIGSHLCCRASITYYLPITYHRYYRFVFVEYHKLESAHIIFGVMLHRSGKSWLAQEHQHIVSTHATLALQILHLQTSTQSVTECSWAMDDTLSAVMWATARCSGMVSTKNLQVYTFCSSVVTFFLLLQVICVHHHVMLCARIHVGMQSKLAFDLWCQYTTKMLPLLHGSWFMQCRWQGHRGTA